MKGDRRRLFTVSTNICERSPLRAGVRTAERRTRGPHGVEYTRQEQEYAKAHRRPQIEKHQNNHHEPTFMP
jgi:hypothetical protein